MSKSSNGKKTKIPKITEAEYAAYISSLKSGEEAPPTSPNATVSIETGRENLED